MLEVREIEPELTYSLRHRVLRPHQSIEDCKYDNDHGEGAFHVGAFIQDELVCVASFTAEDHPDLTDGRQYRLRGMATLPEYRKIGAGRAVVDFAEKVIKSKDAFLLWCNARTTVQEYYQKLGFQAHGDVFDYPPIGPHIVMYKELN